MARDAWTDKSGQEFDGEQAGMTRGEIAGDEAFVERLIVDFPEIKFVRGARQFSYRLKNGVPTVFLGGTCHNFGLLTLHELGHALCEHKDYSTDVLRIKIESAAWERAKTVLLEYYDRAYDGVDSEDNLTAVQGKEPCDVELARILPEWDEEFVQEKLDTYRDWLHVKSRCKKCGLTRYQTEDGEYHCPRCEAFSLAKV